MSFLNNYFLSGGGLAYKVVDLGWNERVLGGVGIFEYAISLNYWVLSFWSKLLGRRLLVSALVMVLWLMGVGF